MSTDPTFTRRRSEREKRSRELVTYLSTHGRSKGGNVDQVDLHFVLNALDRIEDETVAGCISAIRSALDNDSIQRAAQNGLGVALVMNRIESVLKSKYPLT